MFNRKSAHKLVIQKRDCREFPRLHPLFGSGEKKGYNVSGCRFPCREPPWNSSGLQVVTFFAILLQCRVRISPDAEEVHLTANLLASLPVGGVL